MSTLMSTMKEPVPGLYEPAPTCSPPPGIGRLKFSSEQRPDGLLHCLERLDTSLKESEWTVQYAAVVSLQALMTGTLAPESGGRISRLLQERRAGDDTLVVRLRALHALERLVA